MNARIIECSEDEYFADPCAVPSLSQSIAHTLVTKSPLHAWTEHPRLGNFREVEDDSEALKTGKVLHKLLLGAGTDVEVIPFDNFRKKDAQNLKAAAIEAGRVPMLKRKYDDLEAAAETLKGNLLTYFGIDLGAGQSEVAVEWAERGAHGPVLCRGRIDKLQLDRGLIIDVKKIRSADPETCGKHAVEHGHDIQCEAYIRAVSALYPEMEGRLQMLFLNMETEPPYAITPGPLDGELRELGHQRWERAIYLWEDCLRRDHWPAYTNRITPISAPGWAVKKWMEQAASW